MKLLLTKTSKTYLKKLVGLGVLYLLHHEYDNNLEGKICKALCIHKQVEKNNFSVISILCEKVEGNQTYSKNQYGFLLENIHTFLSSWQEIFIKNIKKSCSYLKKRLHFFLESFLLIVNNTNNQGNAIV